MRTPRTTYEAPWLRRLMAAEEDEQRHAEAEAKRMAARKQIAELRRLGVQPDARLLLDAYGRPHRPPQAWA